MNSQVPTKQNFTKESLKKQFRLSEFLAEKIISSVAFLSIAIIFLIFIFVFKESLPIFSQGKESVKTEMQQSTASNDKPESYGAETESLQPESYGGVEKEELQPESYGGVEKEELQPESYGGVEKENLQPESYGGVEKEELQPESYGGVEVEPLVAEDNSAATAEVKEEKESSIWDSLLTPDWVPVSENPRFGLLSLLIGTLKVTIISMLIAGPIAILAALYTACFASKRTKEIIKPIIEMLAAFPSVVIGFFALMIMATFFQDIFGYDSRLNAFVGGVAMALASIPIIYTISEDALSSIPKTYTEASLALGANKWQTAFYVVLPAATPGIFAALLLGVGRVFGETMIALMATGNAALMSANPFESVRTFAATIGAEMAETVFGETHYSVLFFIGSLLFIFSFGLNALAEFYVKGRLIKKFQGK
ncbi:phosphate transport system permease protein [Flavobacterium glycines]|uniref:Phosphate transport system permease protein n=1 Tax=Flavobacterium glycines TaxID=551990 RepID=A0A1B9DS98_9FLAO|nr:phosphate ABC transporter permease subunit PstC [Flavobacterium glycines]OCB72571.1 phosphate ABC transporter permease subunit PstC [Flavobacterium glycines]GEL10065.1 phosphate transport system permease protein [Flavobacterium glycines]SDI82823.1 phosphate transport system permease protein [Flavobacterium glycines]